MAQPAKKSKEAPKRPLQSRRGRPTAERIAAIDAAIHAAALDLFLEVGFEAASMDAIAINAQVSKGTLYARYENKELLFRAILEAQLESWSKRAGEQDHLLPDELEPRLRHHARTIVAVFGWPEFKRVARLLDASTAAFPDLARHWDEIGTERYLRFLAGDMANAGGAGIDWDFYAKMFLFSLSGWHRAQTTQRSVSEEEVVAFADRVIDIILISIGKCNRLGSSA